MPGLTNSRFLFPVTLALAVLSALICVPGLIYGVNETQQPVVLGLVIAINAAVFALLYDLSVRVRRLRNDVTRIAASRGVTERLTVSGNDELADLANNFNVMLNNLEDAHEYLIVAREAAEASDRAKSLLLNEIRRRDEQLSITKGTDR